jgi:cytochrome c2
MKYLTVFLVLGTLWGLVIFLLPSKEKNGHNEFLSGQTSFKKCAPCHALFEESTGGPMYGMLERTPGIKWIYDFTKNPAKMNVTDAYARCLKKKYLSEMPGFMISDKEIDDIFKYVYDEARKRKDIWKNKKFFIPCK